MKIKTKEDYQKRHKPAPKKGKSRKVSVAKESNAALTKRLLETQEERDRAVASLDFAVRVLDKALGMACKPRGLTDAGKTPQAYCDEAEKELMEEMKEA